MAAALGPPEVIAQLENAAKVLMVRTLHPLDPTILGPPLNPAASGFTALWPAGQEGPPGSSGSEEVSVAWRRILHPNFLLPGSPSS